MKELAWFGRFVGWFFVGLGVVAIAMAFILQSSESALAEFLRCTSKQRLGLRPAPCSPPGFTASRPLWIGAGGSAIAAGVFFLLLSGILVTLVETQDLLRGHLRSGVLSPPPAEPTSDARNVIPHYAPGASGAPTMPSRFAMIASHGEDLSGKAWDLMENARKSGVHIPAENAVEEVRRQIAGKR